jgi:hypothetical protein
MWPLRVGAAHTQPSKGFPAISQRVSRMLLTRGALDVQQRSCSRSAAVTDRRGQEGSGPGLQFRAVAVAQGGRTSDSSEFHVRAEQGQGAEK